MLDFRDLVDGTIKKKHGLVSETKRVFLSALLPGAPSAAREIVRKDLLGSVPFDGLWLETRVGGFSYVYIII